MKKTNDGRSPISAMMVPVVIGLCMTLALMAIGSVLVQKGILGEGFVPFLSVLMLMLGSFIAAWIASKRASGNKLVLAIEAGSLVCLVLILFVLCILRQPASGVRLAISIVCMLAASFLGGLAGGTIRKKKKHRHSKR